MKHLRNILSGLVLLVAVALISTPGFAQATLSSTTLSAAMSDASSTSVRVTSATGITGTSTVLYVDKEAMFVNSVSGVTLSVTRGYFGTVANPHLSGSTVSFGPPGYFTTFDRSGSCTSANELVLPVINVKNGNLFTCKNSVWELQQIITNINSIADGNPVRINSRNYAQATGDSIGFQSKPAQSVTSTGTVQGGQVSPRVATGIAVSQIIGLFVDAELKGTSAGTISGDVRALNLELVTDDAGTRTIGGNVNAIRIRSAFSATTITGTFVPIRIEKAESQTNSKQYDAVLDLTGTITGVWLDTGGPTTANGYIKVRINGNDRWLQTFSTAP